jgi:hypothetical protein
MAQVAMGSGGTFPQKLAFALSNVYTKPRIIETKSRLTATHRATSTVSSG